jgi:hypothetical protein
MHLRSLALSTLALVGTSLAAQEGPRFGLQATLNQPQSDLKDVVDSKLGFGIGAHLFVDLGKGHALRPRLDYIWFPEYDLGGATLNVNNLSVGADYLYFVEGKTEGVYFTAGLSANRWKAEFDASGFGNSSESTTKLGLAAGLGYQFNKTVGGELRYQKGKAWEGDFDFIQAGVTFRF